jgi:MFS family permease
MVLMMVAGEIPTGAIADLLGKKNTLTLSFICGFLGNLIMGFAPSFLFLSIAVIITTLASVLNSGTLESLIYDSLLSNKQGGKYQKVLANVSSIKMMSFALASIIGGTMYKISPSLPFISVAFSQLVGIFFTFFLKEPPIDSQIFSWKNYRRQIKKGFQELFTKNKNIKEIILIIMLGIVIIINYHSLIDVQLVAQGWQETQLGLIYSITFVLGAIVSQLGNYLNRRFGQWISIIFSALLIGLNMLISTNLGILMATVLIMLRSGFDEIFFNSVSNKINHSISSKYRATTLSTYNMLINIPYIIFAYLLGSLIDKYSVAKVVNSLGLILLLIVLLNLLQTIFAKKNKIITA